ncbi:OPT oligopeptide transporter protein-domain-containing protein [Zopfochytrium polystomum]|nr:OPT oligopeptide transporter protein-domain-containing protein [Zopfochytrium polystomum]
MNGDGNNTHAVGSAYVVNASRADSDSTAVWLRGGGNIPPAKGPSPTSEQWEAELKHQSVFEGELEENALQNGDYDGEDDAIYDIVDTIVPRTDDPTTPALTFRVIVLGTIMAMVLAGVNTVFTIRSNPFSLNPFIAVLVAYPMGTILSKILPSAQIPLPFTGGDTFTLNPGPFNHKEHALIFVFALCGANVAYALYNIVAQKYILGQTMLSTGWSLAFALVTQTLGLSLAGLARKFLVRPAAMLWPANLSIIALLNTLHLPDDKTLYRTSRTTALLLTAAVTFAYEWLPTYVGPLLGTVSLLCYAAPQLSRARVLGSATGGVGLLSFSFDWSIVGSTAPITTPLWAVLNQVAGAWLFLWVVIPILWSSDAFGIDSRLGTNPAQGPNGTGQFPLGFALNSPSLFDRNGVAFPSLSLLDAAAMARGEGAVLDEAFYESVRPVRITTYFAVQYLCGFMAVSAAIVHVYLWYGSDIAERWKASVGDLDHNDVHCQLMNVYKEVPDAWYFTLLLVCSVLGFACGTVGGFDLPWWSILLALGLAGITIIPFGTITAISGQSIGLNIVAELVMGLILPGRFVAVMSFKTLCYMTMYQCVFFLQNMKLGHYLKIAPRKLFAVQLLATAVATVVNVGAAVYVFDRFGAEAINGSGGWNAAQYRTFVSAGAIWGAVGPARFFGPSSPYFPVLLGFPIGLLLPLLPYLLSRLLPSAAPVLNLVNTPLLVIFPAQVGGLRSDLLTPLIVALAVNWGVKKWRAAWWGKYAYVVSSAMDVGTAVALMAVFFGVVLPAGGGGWRHFYALNRVDQEACSPDFYETCLEHIISAGPNYNPAEDIPVCQSFGLAQ